MPCMTLRHLARTRGVSDVSTGAGGCVSGVRLLGGCGESVRTMCRVALLSGSCTCSGAVSRVSLCRACDAVLSMSGVITSNGRGAGRGRMTRMRTMVLPTRSACRRSLVTSMAHVPLVTGGCSAMTRMRRSRRTARRGQTVSSVRVTRLRRVSVPGVRVRGANMGSVRVG
jgi:hypothetical protein